MDLRQDLDNESETFTWAKQGVSAHTIGAWHFAALVHDRGALTVTLYVDGVRQGGAKTTKANGYVGTNGHLLWLGRNWGYYMKGQIGAFASYHECVLDHQDVSMLYHGLTVAPSSGLVVNFADRLNWSAPLRMGYRSEGHHGTEPAFLNCSRLLQEGFFLNEIVHGLAI